MFLYAFISSLILLESREIGHCMFSQPFFISLLLIVMGFDPYFVLISATATHLFFIHYIPSGASKFPEYPYAFFLVAASTAGIHSDNITTTLIGISFILIVLISRLSAVYVMLKRKRFAYLSGKYIKDPSVQKARIHLSIFLIYSFISGFVVSLSALFMFKWFWDYISSLRLNSIPENMIILFLFAFLMPFIVKKKKIIYASIGLIILTVIWIFK